jgi:hypothetical protein
VTDYYVPVGAGSAVLNYTTGGAPPAASVNGSLELTTPRASAHIPNMPSILNTTQIWHQLDVAFVLLPNTASFSLYAGSYLVDESEYLAGEFGCEVYYANAQWIVLTVPST